MRVVVLRVIRTSLLACCFLTACAENPTAPVDVLARRSTGSHMCVAPGDDETPVVVVPPSANQTCPPGFDLIVWW